MKRLFAISILVNCLLVAGCDTGPKTVPAEGVLTMGGTPLADAAIVVMYPDGNSASGASDKDGKFKLNYLNKIGALPGTDLKVGVSKGENPYGAGEAMAPTGPPKDDKEATERMEKAQKMMQDQMKAQQAKMKAGGSTVKALVDTKFASPETSGLKLTIPEGGSTELKIAVP